MVLTRKVPSKLMEISVTLKLTLMGKKSSRIVLEFPLHSSCHRRISPSFQFCETKSNFQSSVLSGILGNSQPYLDLDSWWPCSLWYCSIYSCSHGLIGKQISLGANTHVRTGEVTVLLISLQFPMTTVLLNHPRYRKF